jgi:hypothetical protein
MTTPDKLDKKVTLKTIGVAVLLLITAAALVYIVQITCGNIPSEDRLGSKEIAIGAGACFLIILLTNPETFSRLSFIKLPGGAELKLEQLEKKQEVQKTYLDAFFAILANSLSSPEKYHLRALSRGGEEYEGKPTLRDELLRLKRYGLIDEVEGQKIGDLFDRRKDNFAKYVRLTETGEQFIVALRKIESQ